MDPFQAGGFPEQIIINEDTLLAARLVLAGYKIAYAPEARVFHSHDYTLLQQMKRYFDIGASHRDNRRVLERVSVSGEGMRFLREEARYLIEGRELMWLPSAVAEAVFKYIGYKTGLNYRLVPNALGKRISMHSYHWTRGAKKR